jgi:hypothetical protein
MSSTVTAPPGARLDNRLAGWIAPAPADQRRQARPWRLLLAGCLALATLSLLLPSVPTYDPWAWLIWGREILHGQLVTTTGPSWKPLPVLFTTPFALLGTTGAPLAWLVVARAGGILAFAMAYRLGARLAGPVAGAIAAGGLILCQDFIFNFARGNSEGILVAVCLWAIERHLDGRRVDAFVLGIAAALMRPEVWPFVAAYGLWLLWRDRSRPTTTLVVGGGVVVALLWFVPEYLGSGDFLRAAARARQPNLDSPAYATHPFLTVLHQAVPMLSTPIYVGAVIALVVAIRRRDRLVLALGGGAALMMLVVAAMTEGGFAGNMRYVALPAAFVCVLSGVGWVWLGRAVMARGGAVALGAVVVAGSIFAFSHVRADTLQLRGNALMVADEARFYGSVPEAIAAAGGAEGLKACGPIYTGAFQTQTVVWYMHVHETGVGYHPAPPGVAIAPIFEPLSRDARFPVIARTERWVVGASCVG